MISRRKKLYLNTTVAFILQLVTFVCGFILPRYFLLYFGSDINGLVTSISRFLSVISFLEFGVGPVIQSNLYSPLANRDSIRTSQIIVSADKFYKRIALIFVVYIGILFFVYPLLNKQFDFIFTASLILILSISTFAQYYFGITYQVFLDADQKLYIGSSLQILTVILNTFLCIILMKLGFSVHIVKLVSSLVFVIRPIMLNLYVKSHYNLDFNVTYDDEPIKQKWNGFAQHIAAVVTEEIDTFLLTFFSGYQSVSIYSIYFMVTNGVTKIVMTSVSGLESFWGNMIAKCENVLLLKTFDWVECLIHAGVSFLYSVTIVLIVPFVSVYVSGAPDSSAYLLPFFGGTLTLAYAFQCLRVPYFRIIKAAGHYKQTQNGAFISMFINIFLSLVLIFNYGIAGASIGTLFAMLFHTVYFVFYLRKNIIHRSIKYFFNHLIVDCISFVLILFFTKHFCMYEISYLAWIFYAMKVCLVSFVVVLSLNLLFYRNQYKSLLKKLLNKD